MRERETTRIKIVSGPRGIAKKKEKKEINKGKR